MAIFGSRFYGNGALPLHCSQISNTSYCIALKSQIYTIALLSILKYIPILT